MRPHAHTAVSGQLVTIEERTRHVELTLKLHLEDHREPVMFFVRMNHTEADNLRAALIGALRISGWLD